MNTGKAMEQRQMQQDSGHKPKDHNLDRRYGEIGISAVAAAVCHKGERRPAPVRKATIDHFEYD